MYICFADSFRPTLRNSLVLSYVYFMLTVPGPPEQIKALAMTSDSIMVA
jgi:hypothetical protein